MKKQVNVKNKLDCVTKVINFSSIERTSRFDKNTFDPKTLIKTLPQVSPKMVALLENIQKLDKKDYNKDGKLYKHFIYSGVKMGYGAKMIASCMVAAGYTLLNKPEGSKITLNYDLVNSKDETKTLLLSSTALWNNATSPKTTKEILTTFNKRPENSYGDLARFIILDSGFVEGIDLYDIKYIHMFEEQLYDSQFIQATGRGLRFKGQCGLPFTKNKGWTVEIFNYKLYKMKPRDLSKFEFFNGKENILEIFKKQDKSLKYKENLQKNLFDILKSGAVDYTLNKNINGLIEPTRFNLIKTIKLGVSFIRDSIDYKLLQRKKINL